MLQKIKQKIRIYKIKKEAAQHPRTSSATMEDVQRKLAGYNSPVKTGSKTAEVS